MVEAAAIGHPYPAAPGIDEPVLFHAADYPADIGATHPQQRAQLVLGERNVDAAGAIHCRAEPARGALFDGMRGVAGDRLQ